LAPAPSTPLEMVPDTGPLNFAELYTYGRKKHINTTYIGMEHIPLKFTKGIRMHTFID